ncbi:hypothetical protein OIC43_15575 [Streptomyces sp. NBC_00825]|uniref:hypothetical protein n=1 Tax=unclassified Streptomyces TaxID=2593676 RepID=UPI00225B6181|nr:MULTISPECIES: hypothetical protein [unclassified Streptomyces]MCX4864509.1 hypothetical protein [Streptomyces sp. NBC_00906]WTH90366.1 hypothetical protein OIC43_15575 [Streptomyces sp. NBC_00825]
MILAGLLVGCSGSEKKAVPELPKRICWNVFASSDVLPILPAGDKADVYHRPFALVDDLDSVTCTLAIDGAPSFQAIATRRGFEDQIDWSPMDEADPQPIDVGKKGIIWDSGAAAYFICEPSKGPNSPGKYIDLHIAAGNVSNEAKLPSVLPPLMKQFVAFAQRELKCGASSGD